LLLLTFSEVDEGLELSVMTKSDFNGLLLDNDDTPD